MRRQGAKICPAPPNLVLSTSTPKIYFSAVAGKAMAAAAASCSSESHCCCPSRIGRPSSRRAPSFTSRRFQKLPRRWKENKRDVAAVPTAGKRATPLHTGQDSGEEKAARAEAAAAAGFENYLLFHNR